MGTVSDAASVIVLVRWCEVIVYLYDYCSVYCVSYCILLASMDLLLIVGKWMCSNDAS